VLLQDACRYTLFAGNGHRVAALLDFGWLVAFAGLLCAESVRTSPSLLLSTWALTGTASALAGLAIVHWRPNLRLAWKIARREIATSVRFVLEFAFSVGVPQTLLILVGVLGTLEDGAAYRLASTLLAPAGIVAAGLVAGLQSLAARDARTGSSRRVGNVVTVVAPTAVIACWLVVEFAPEALGERLFGASFASALPLVRILAVAGVFAAASLGAQVTLRAKGLLRQAVRVRVATGVLALIAAPFAISAIGPTGAALVYTLMSAAALIAFTRIAVDSPREGEPRLRN
jgi:O-antigen/teichoic acid export membrane protein